jgi:transposase-like protein
MSKRREFSAQFKLETVLEGLRGEKSVAQICRERDITDSLYYKWRDEFMERALSIFTAKRHKGMDESSERIAELERWVGRLTMELEIAKKHRACWDHVGRQTDDDSAPEGSLSGCADLRCAGLAA